MKGNLLNGNKATKILLILGFFLFIIILRIKFPEADLFRLSGYEASRIGQINQLIRQGPTARVYNLSVGKIYFDKFMGYSPVVLKKIFYPLDISRYFSLVSDGTLPYFFVLFFIIGLLAILKKYPRNVFIYCFLAMPASIFIESGKTIYLYYPLVIIAICLGIIYCLKRIIQIRF